MCDITLLGSGAMKEDVDRFPARLPAGLKRALADKADALPGTSMNDLVVLGVRHVVEGSDLVVTTSGVADAREDLVVAAIGRGIGPAKGIAQHYVDAGQPNLGSLLYWVAAQMQADEKEAAKELVRSAEQVKKRSRPIAIALLRAALDCNPASHVAKNRLGQLLYFDGDYAGAKALLESVRDDDNYAKLFYGWSTLELAGDDRSEITRAREEIAVALRRWALGDHYSESREKWLDHVRDLKARGSEFDQAVEDLVEYANDNSSWKRIDKSEIYPSPRNQALADGGGQAGE